MTGRRTTIAALGGLLLLAPLALAGCSSAGSSTPSASETSTSIRAASWGTCMRSAGFDVQDPSDEEFGSGVERVPADVDRAAFESASKSCRGADSGGPSAADKAGYEQDAQDFSQCMRDNGVDDFPDPEQPGVIKFDQGNTSPTYTKAEATCKATVLKGWGGL